jgi:uncharacterized protein (TIGR03905 family)
MRYSYETRGTCSIQIDFELDEQGIIKDVSFIGGCDGNLQAVCRLVNGMKAVDAIKKLRGIRCGYKNTSCPDQLAIALAQAVDGNNEKQI